MKWIGENIRDYVSRFRNDVYITGDLDIAVSKGLSIGGVDILTDSSGTTTLNNIDALDATTEATIEAAVDTLASLTTAAGLTSIGSAGATTDIAAGDLTMYNPVNDGNPTISLGSSATNRLEIKSVYNSGAQTIDEVYFSTYTTSSTSNDGRYIWEVDEVQLAKLIDTGLSVFGNIISNDAGAQCAVIDTTATSATQGGKLVLIADDGAAISDNHRLGVIEFKGAEDGSATRSIGARIQAVARDAWDGSNNDADLEFYTTDGTTESKVLTLDADKLATFTGTVAVAGFKGTGSTTVTNILDEDAMGSDSATALATQQSIKAYADTKVSSDATKQFTYHMIKDDIDTTKIYIGLQEADAENATASNKFLPLLAPVAGKLLKIFLRANNDFSGRTLTWRLETHSSSSATSGTPTVVGTQSGTGCTASSMTTYDFTSSLDSGDNVIDAGDTVQLSIQSSGTTSDSNMFITCLWEWDLS